MEKLTAFALYRPDGGEISIKCYTLNKTSHVEQHAEGDGTRVYASYCNRPWESFEYETALRKWVKAYTNDPRTQSYLMAQIDAIGEAEAKEAEAWLADFKKRWDAVDPDLKERTARALEGHEVSSVEEGETILKTAEAFTALKKLGA